MRSAGVDGSDFLQWGSAAALEADLRLAPFTARKLLAARGGLPGGLRPHSGRGASCAAIDGVPAVCRVVSVAKIDSVNARAAPFAGRTAASEERDSEGFRRGIPRDSGGFRGIPEPSCTGGRPARA